MDSTCPKYVDFGGIRGSNLVDTAEFRRKGQSLGRATRWDLSSSRLRTEPTNMAVDQYWQWFTNTNTIFFRLTRYCILGFNGMPHHKLLILTDLTMPPSSASAFLCNTCTGSKIFVKSHLIHLSNPGNLVYSFVIAGCDWFNFKSLIWQKHVRLSTYLYTVTICTYICYAQSAYKLKSTSRLYYVLS